MSECALIACLGANDFRINTTTTARTQRRQYVVIHAHSRYYVYTQNGKVVSIQN